MGQSTTEEAAQDIANFVYVFFEHFTQFRGRRFHLAGESHAGRYIPIFAGYIHDQNEVVKKRGMVPINLASIMIGELHSNCLFSHNVLTCLEAMGGLIPSRSWKVGTLRLVPLEPRLHPS
jgi:carboxypeptidase C (cathepsin A)